MYGKVVFSLATEAAAQEAVERGLAVGGVFVPLEPLEDLGVRLVLTSIPPFLPNAALLPALSALGKLTSVISPLPLGCKDPTLRHVLSFRRQVQLLPPAGVRDGEALEGSFLVPYQGARYRVFYSTGEARCYLCRSAGHVRRDCPLARGGGAPETPETRQDIGPVVANAPGCPAPETNPPPTQTIATPVRAQETPSLQRPGEQGSPTLATTTSAEPMEEGAAKTLPGIGEGPPQGEPPAPQAASPLPPRTPEPLPPPPDTTPANQPPDDAMEGWNLVQGKRGKRKARAPLHSSDAEAPRKTRKGGTDIEPSATTTSEIHPLVLGGEDRLALEGRTPPPWGTLPSETPEDTPSARIPSQPPANPEATAEAGPRGEAPGVAGVGLSSVYAEIEALDLTLVTQGEDDLLPAGLELGNLTPAPLSPCSLPLIAFPGEHPAEGGPPPDAMAAKTTTEPAPSITGSPFPYPLTLDSAQEQHEMDLITPACQTPRWWSAPCLPALADHEAVLRAPPGNTPGTVTPPPHELRHALRKFLEHTRGAHNRAHSSTIRPRPGPAYWHFNNSLLEDESFVTSFREFWLAWREQWSAFPSVRRWWDLGKVRAKLFCRDYTRGTSRRRNAAIEQLEREVLEMERRLAADPEDPSLCGACREKREELQALEDHRAQGAFVRSRIRLLREMDRGSRFFYALEKTRGMRLAGLVLWEPELRLVLSAYADDVLLVVQDPGDLARVEACQAIYSAASSARVNWVKSSGLAVGDWRQL
ncbi:unnamed protein product, partial [Natator depressus]